MARVLVLRPEADAARVADLLSGRGAEAILSPVLEIESLPVTLPERAWSRILLTSRHGAKALIDQGLAARLADVPVVAVGAATAAAARAAGFHHVRSVDGAAADLVAALRAENLTPGAALLYGAGEDRTGDIDGILRRDGFEVTLAVLYRARAAAALTAAAEQALVAGQVDAVQVMSRRTGEIFLDLVARAGLIAAARLISVHAMSEEVAAPFRALGFHHVAVAAHPRLGDVLDLVAPSNKR